MKSLPLLGILAFAANRLSAKHISHHYDVHIMGNYVDSLKKANPPSESNEMISKARYLNKVYFDICEPAYRDAGAIMTQERFKYIALVLNFLYEFCSAREYELAAVTATVLHNTSYLRIFEAPGSDKYKPRGIFQICTKKNYAILESIAFFYHDYVENPERVGTFSIHVLVDITCFWLHMSFAKKRRIDIYDVLSICNPSEYEILRNKSKYSREEVKKAEERFANRDEIYQKMLSIIYINYYRE
ncbi:hypothetical protein [Encephalitozoon cuniculi GB-M1]|uniref:Uncharacterized protein ECU05_1040 n=2 Tax=Encephalitozoon cuniculi TaxID=6035 RepID=Y5A4_ENCCU|nr:uncharacterized protein ECU05_1040 [Encephalitozoon cuniculi GB-M1]Q8SVI9.1 RecName: Full=Uncharacterized protein ECU05_1040; Flags: Precursor [Encephalitozoon cuniculi GB-M1]AGE95442.1 hypothetical protein ECU05_1040 [Encephalitozoon cuniculi]KMV66161.1 hypothetical protein M970_051040 [Encephalitozoon cuniculi EcunIII-L]UYI27898.1 putative chitinase [Encephalitozoon cuniculi]CAD26624.1 hypothetical protein [Encephalitozoon cuniculi GB-M1]